MIHQEMTPGPVMGPGSCFPLSEACPLPQGETQMAFRYSIEAALVRGEVVSAGWMIWTPD